MRRLTHAWAAMSRERRIAAVAALALLVTMFFPWYGLQSLNRKTGAIYSHDINAFGDVSFVEAAIFLVAAGVTAMLLARAEEREFSLPGGDGTIVAIAGGWAAVLIFYRVFDRPSGHGYPVGIEWGFFLAFVAAGSLAYAGWRMRHGERPEPPAARERHPPGGGRADHPRSGPGTPRPIPTASPPRLRAGRRARRDAVARMRPGRPPRSSPSPPHAARAEASRASGTPRRHSAPHGASARASLRVPMSLSSSHSRTRRTVTSPSRGSLRRRGSRGARRSRRPARV